MNLSKLLFIFILLTQFAFAGNDKGNVGDVHHASSQAQDLLMEYGIDLEEITYATLISKKALIDNGEIKTTVLPELLSNQAMTRPFKVLVMKLIKMQEFELLASITSNNPNFYEAFGIIELTQRISLLPLSESKKEATIEQVQSVMKNFWSMIRKEVLKESSEKEWSTFIKGIDQERLGYKI